MSPSDLPTIRDVSSNPAAGPIMSLPTAFNDGSVNVQVPTAAMISVAGRVLTSEGRGVKNVMVSLTDNAGVPRRVMSGPRGFFHFEDVEAGQSYVLSATARRYQFTSQIINVTDNISDFEFRAEP